MKICQLTACFHCRSWGFWLKEIIQYRNDLGEGVLLNLSSAVKDVKLKFLKCSVIHPPANTELIPYDFPCQKEDRELVRS